MTRYLFNTGRGQSGLAAFQMNLVKVCIEDEAFFKENYETIQPNDYSDEYSRALLFYLKEMKDSNIEISYDTLKEYIDIRLKEGDFNKVVLKDTIDSIQKNKSLDEDEIDDIKNTYMCFALYASMLKLSNVIRDKALDGYVRKQELLRLFERVQEEYDDCQRQYQRLICNIGEVEGNEKSENRW